MASKMTKKEKFAYFIEYFSQNMPDAETELSYNNPYELLVAVILSAQCTDKRVNIVTPPLFKRFPDAASLAKGSFEEVFKLIKSISFPNNKAKHLIGMAQILHHEYKDIVPSDINALQKMPGVGRKTANVIASVIYQKPTMAVDTHVFRVSKRIGLVTQTAKTPLEVEKQLIKYIPESQVHISHHWLILHGRYTCLARSPKCDQCKITKICAFYYNKQKKANKID